MGSTSKAVLQEVIKGLKETFEHGDISSISKSGSVLENVQSYVGTLNSSKYFDTVIVDHLNGKYIFEIKG